MHNEPEGHYSRNDYIANYTAWVLTLLGTVTLLFGFSYLAALLFAAAYVGLLCYLTQNNPTRIVWRMARRAVGHRFDTRFHWGELSVCWPRFDLELKFAECCGDRDRDCLIVHASVFRLYLYLPTNICSRFRDPKTSKMDRDSAFGFYTIDTAVVWRWATGYWSWDIPFFSFKHESSEVLTASGRSVFFKPRGERFMDRYDEQKLIEARYSEIFRYVYTLKCGEVQERMATVGVRRMTWIRKWFPWLKKVRTSIDVVFDQEVGEETGSWKGGCTGCGYDMLPGEQPVDTLRRMERERKF